MKIGDLIKHHREEVLGITRAEYARISGIDPGHLARLEDSLDEPGRKTLQRLISAFHFSADKLSGVAA